MTSLIALIQSYGYIALFIGSIFEGESVVLLGGLAAHENYLLFPLVVLFAALGAIVGDWGFFFLGRYKGQSFFKRFPSLLKMSQKPRELIEKRPRFLSFAMRFMYGFRHIVPASLGASNIPTRQFLFWNGLGAVSWALLVAIGGYLAANALEQILGDIRRYEFRIIVVTVLVIVIFRLVYNLGRWLLQSKSDV